MLCYQTLPMQHGPLHWRHDTSVESTRQWNNETSATTYHLLYKPLSQSTLGLTIQMISLCVNIGPLPPSRSLLVCIYYSCKLLHNKETTELLNCQTWACFFFHLTDTVHMYCKYVHYIIGLMSRYAHALTESEHGNTGCNYCIMIKHFVTQVASWPLNWSVNPDLCTSRGV